MPPRRKSALEDLIKQGFVADGELLRYKSKHGQLMAVGRAREGGIEVAGTSKLLGYTAFEDIAGSKYHRPAEHTHTTTGRTLQSLALLAGGGAGGGAGKRGGKAAPPPEPVVELLEDDNDDLCHICGLGGDLMCCETCPGVFHAACLGLAAPPEGDYHCPLCRCSVCGAGGSQGLMPTGCEWLDCAEFVGLHSLQRHSRPHIAAEAPGAAAAAKPQPAAAPAPAAAAGAAGEGSGAGAAAPGGDSGGGDPMQVDGPAPAAAAAAAAAAAEGAADFSRLAAAACGAPAVVQAPAEADGAMAGAADADGDAAVRCPVTCRWSHLRCFPPEFADTLRQGGPQPCISTTDALTASKRLAAACAAGVIPLGCMVEGARATPSAGEVSSRAFAELPLSLLVVRGAAAAAPRDCRGIAPAYTPDQRQELRVALSAALHVLHSCYEPLPDSRTGADMLPWLLRGAVLAGGKADYSGMHTAVLFAGPAAVAVAVFRSFGDLAEVPVLAVRPELQRRNGLGRLLLAAVEQLLLLAGAKAIFTPAFTADGAPYIAVPPPAAATAAAEAAAGGAAGPPAEPQQPQQAEQPALPPPLQAKWGYSLAPAEVMQQVVTYPLVRLPGVLLAFKPLAAHTVLLPPRLPPRLRWSGGLDPRQLLRQGWLASLALPAPPGKAAAAARPPPAPAPGRKAGRSPKAAAPKQEMQESNMPQAAPPTGFGAGTGWVQQQQRQLAPAVGAAGAAGGPTPAQLQQQQQQMLALMYQQQQAAAQRAGQAPAYQQMLLAQQQQVALMAQQQPEAYAALMAQYSAQHQQQLAAAQQLQLAPGQQQLQLAAAQQLAAAVQHQGMAAQQQQLMLAQQQALLQQQQQQQRAPQGPSLVERMLQQQQQQQQQQPPQQ